MKATTKKYNDRVAQAEAQLTEIANLIKAHKANSNNGESAHYGHIGDIAYVNEQLQETINFLNGYENEE